MVFNRPWCPANRKRRVDDILHGLHVAELMACNGEHDARWRIAGLESCFPGAHYGVPVDDSLAIGRPSGRAIMPRQVTAGNRDRDLT
jgi:hypothetical protein